MISIESISKDFKERETVKVIGDISLKVNEGEFVTIFGPNGSGKTTLLNIVAGLDTTTSGEVTVNGKNSKDASVGFVFQNYNESLFPWRTVIENITLSLEERKIEKKERERVGLDLLKKVDLLHLKDKFVYELSGGQKQLVSICRALAYDPEILLMDEPFSSLDYSTTKNMELELLKIWQENKITTLFVSHDIDEAILLADKVVILSPKPSKIKKIFKIDLPRPRTLDMLGGESFMQIRSEILKIFEFEHDK